MARGDKSAYTDKQKRQAEHIEEGYEKKAVSEDEAEHHARAIVNKQDGGGKESGAGRKKSSKSSEDAPDRDSSATKGSAGTRPPSDS